MTDPLPVPAGLAYLPYQEEGIRAMRYRREILLADEMGLGKTIQVVGVLNCRPDLEHVIVVCPASLAINWRRELDRWLRRIVEIDIVSYDSLGDADLERGYDLAVFDEAHYLKTPGARRSRDARCIRAGFRMLLTGTPIPNRPIELWHLLHILLPDRFPLSSMRAFGILFCGGHLEEIEKGGKKKRVWRFDGATNLDRLAAGLRPMMVRRLKRDVLKDLPRKRRQPIEIPAAGIAPELLKDLADAGARYDDARLDADAETVFAETSRLRHQVGLAKAPAVVAFVIDVLEAERKIVVFAYHLDVIGVLADGLREFEPEVVTGSTPLPNRQAAVDRFQDPMSSARVFIGQIKAMGVGHTLTAASNVVFAELDWCPGTMSQAEDRCDRIGQTCSVLARHLVLEGTIDARMVLSVIRKQEIADAVLDAGPTAPKEKPVEKIVDVLAAISQIAQALPSIANRLDDAVVLLESLSRRLNAEAPKPEAPAASAPIASVATPTTASPASAIPAAPSTPTDAEKARREFLKKELRARGIAFSASARTATLEELFAQLPTAAPSDPFAASVMAPLAADPFAEAPAQPTAPTPAADPFADVPTIPASAPTADLFADAPMASAPSPAAIAPAALTKEDVRAGLRALQAAKGNDVALGVLAAVGGTPKLSDVPESKYPALLAACKAGLK